MQTRRRGLTALRQQEDEVQFRNEQDASVYHSWRKHLCNCVKQRGGRIRIQGINVPYQPLLIHRTHLINSRIAIFVMHAGL